MTKKKLNMSIAGLFDYLMNDVNLDEVKTQIGSIPDINNKLNTMGKELDRIPDMSNKLDTMDKKLITIDNKLDTIDKKLITIDKKLDRIPYIDKKLDMTIYNQGELFILLYLIKEMIDNIGTGSIEGIITIEGEKIPIGDFPKNEDGMVFIELKHSALIPGSVSVKIDGKQIDDYTVNHYRGEITLGKNVKGKEVQYTYQYLSEGINDRELLTDTRFEDVEFTKSLVRSFPYVVPKSKDTSGKVGDLAYVNHSFQNSSDQKKFEVDAVQIESDPNYLVIDESIFGDGASNKIVYPSESNNEPLVFVIPTDSNLGKFGEYWVEGVQPGRFIIKNTGFDGKARILIILDPGAHVSGKANFSPGEGSKITHNLKLNPKEYTVLVQSIENSEGSIGEIWIEKDKNSFTVHNTGSAKTKFNYLIIEG